MLTAKKPGGEEEEEDYFELAAYRDALLQERTRVDHLVSLLADKTTLFLLISWDYPGIFCTCFQAAQVEAEMSVQTGTSRR